MSKFKSTFLSKIFFSEALGIVQQARSKVLQSEDSIPLDPRLSVYNKNSEWINEDKIDWSNGRSIYLSSFKATRKIMIPCVWAQIVASLFAFTSPVIMNQFMVQLENLDLGNENWTYLILLAVGFGLSGAGHGIIIQQYFFKTLNYFQIITNVVNKKIFDHALKLSQKSKSKYQIGDIVNFMSSDADAIGDAAITSIDLGNAVVLLVGGSGLLFYYIGWSAMPAIIVMGLLIPLTQKLAKKFMHLEEEMLAHRDARMTLMTQVLNAIRVIKFFSWEKSISEEVRNVRDKEIYSRTQFAKAEIAWGLIYASISTVVLFTALLTHYLRGQPITLSVIFTCISIFSLMEHQFGGLSRFISRFINIFVSGDRISNFLKSDEVQTHIEPEGRGDVYLDFKDVDFSYAEKKLLSKLSFQIKKGESLAIVGPVGVGKTTLLQLILEEVNPISGHIQLQQKKQVCFVPQEAFIVNTSLEENLKFGQVEVSQAEIDKALFLSCLKQDVDILPAGLNTEIGEKGVNLSGGQKQRVSLARAVLSRSELILLDDPLSAVDPNTENLLCDRLLFGEWKGRNLICVTHRIAHLRRFDKVLYLKENSFEFDTFENLNRTSEDFRKYIELEQKNKDVEKEIHQEFKISTDQEKSTQQETSRVTVDEDRAIGSVKTSIYWDYIKSLGGESKYQRHLIFLLAFSATLFVTMPLLQKLWLTQAESKQMDSKNLLIVYGVLGVLSLIVVYCNNLLWTYRGVSAGKLFHDKVLRSVLKSEIRFFDSTPIGRILQRFSRDVESVDIHLQWSFDAAIHSLLHVLIALVLIVSVLPISILFMIPLLLYYYILQNDYRRAAREVKRLDSLARSPRYAHFKETLQGLSVIRGFRQQEWFRQEFYKKLENSVQAFYTHLYLNRWFSTRLPLVGAAISMLTTMAIVFSVYKNWLTAGMAGLVTIYALDFWKHLNWGVRIFSDLESRMTSVERLTFYSELPSEKEYVEQSAKINSGSLEFKNVYLRYADHLPYVLKNVSFQIPSGHRVGIVGRTGSGKSTLFQAVYRFIQYDQGDILIGGESLRNFKLEDLRRMLSVIPQDPTLFMGSLRLNLDRYHEKTEAEIWSVLEKVSLAGFVRSLPEGLDYKLTENGSNLSQGQRQLICLARALLLKVKILFLDEATASVDLETDAIIQKVIRESLGDMTLVTIAHRVSTLHGYDQIIELQNGEVVSNFKLESSSNSVLS